MCVGRSLPSFKEHVSEASRNSFESRNFFEKVDLFVGGGHGQYEIGPTTWTFPA